MKAVVVSPKSSCGRDRVELEGLGLGFRLQGRRLQIRA